MRTRLERRPQSIVSYAHFQLEPLEGRVLLSSALLEWSPPANPTLATETVISADTSTALMTPYALSDTFALHSNPGAAHRIYLDFDGHVTSGTSWNSSFNGGTDIVTPAYDFDGDTSTFSSLELERIQYIFDRVAADFMPFDVDVTTEAPLLDGLVKSGSSDDQWGVRVAIGGSSGDWFGTAAGGVAYYNSFNWSSDTPAFVFEKQLGNGNEKYTAEAISHEVGHTLNLRHDGTSSAEYYQGEGSGETGWAPIMGAGYYKNLTQWSRGEYLDANNAQDDLAIITTNNGFGYRNDDFGSDFASATVLLGSEGAFQSGGIIERNTDVDVFSFLTGGGSINIDIFADGRSPNLDVMAQLYDDSFTLLAASNPSNLLSANIATTVGAGTYFLKISGGGKGDPLDGGYSDYASLGQYTISGQVVDIGPMLAVNDVTVNEADGSVSFTVSLSQAMTEAVSVDVMTADGSAVAGSDYTAVIQTLTFQPGQTVGTISIPILQDSLIESTETFGVRLSNASTNVTIADDYGVASILDDDVSVSIADASIQEGNPGKGKKQTLKTTDMVFTVSLSGASDSVITVAFETADGTAIAGEDYLATSGTLTFNPGEITKTLTVAVIGDDLIELNETLYVNLSGAINTAIADGAAVGTILDNDSSGGGGGSTKKRGGPKKGLVASEELGAFYAAMALAQQNEQSAVNDADAGTDTFADSLDDSDDSLLARLLDAGSVLQQVA